MFELGLLSTLLLAAFVILHKKRLWNVHGHGITIVLQMLSLGFCVTYIVFVLASVSFFDAGTPLDSRILSPVFVFLLVAAVSLCWNVAQAINKPLVWRFFVVFLFFSIIINADHARSFAVAMHNNGRGYAVRSWRNSESIAFVRSLSNRIRIYSNGPDVIGFLTEKQAIWIPQEVCPSTLMPNDDFAGEMQAMYNDCTQNGAMLVYFKNIRWRWYLPTQEELQSACKLPVSRRLADGTIYGEGLR